MYRIEKTDYGLRLMFSGFIAKPEMIKWADEMQTAVKGALPKFGVIIDMRELKPLAPDVQDVMTSAQAGAKKAGMGRSCVILNSKIVTMQFERLAKESGVYQFERYIDASTKPDFESAARNWVASGLDDFSAQAG